MSKPTFVISPLMRLMRTLAVAVPVVCAALPLSEPLFSAKPRMGTPPAPHATDVWLGEHMGVSVSPDWDEAGKPHTPLHHALGRQPEIAPVWRASTAVGLAEGFEIVGSVAVLAGDDLTVTRQDAAFGVQIDNLKEVSRRFIRAFGDDYDQIAVFLGFSDRLSLDSLAYQIPVKNDVAGLGLGTFDATEAYGSPSGRMQTMLNMKRISVYGVDAADDPEDILYPVWAQESAHRWLTYFHYRFPGDTGNRDDLLGRQKAHWAPWVNADASVMDGVSWKDNADGTFSVVERIKRFGVLDQYAMGLRAAAEVPPFFLLDDFVNAQDQPVKRNEISISRRDVYKARRIDVTVQDIIRAEGPRAPPSGGAAVDLRMAVVFLMPPGVQLRNLIGEAFLLDQTRAPWDNFYNEAGGGRGKVCTQLLRPCRGPSFVYGAPKLQAVGPGALAPGVVAPGDTVTVTIPVSNLGDEAAAANVSATPALGLALAAASVSSMPIAPQTSGTVTFTGTLAKDAPCGYPIGIDLEAPGRLGPSRGRSELLIGMIPLAVNDFESADAAAAWVVNPDKTDNAVQGMWEVGAPEQTVAEAVLKSFVVQTAGGYESPRALVTGAAAGGHESANDVDFDGLSMGPGRTTVQSPTMDLSTANKPILSYRVHFTAAAFRGRLIIAADLDNLRVLGSADGQTWIELDRTTGFDIGWQHRMIDLAAKFGGTAPQRLTLRFVAEDDSFESNPVEAVVDDVNVYSLAPTCTTTEPLPKMDMPPLETGGGGGCSIGHREGGSGNRGGAWLALIALALAARTAKSRRSVHRRKRARAG